MLRRCMVSEKFRPTSKWETNQENGLDDAEKSREHRTRRTNHVYEYCAKRFAKRGWDGNSRKKDDNRDYEAQMHRMCQRIQPVSLSKEPPDSLHWSRVFNKILTRKQEMQRIQ